MTREEQRQQREARKLAEIFQKQEKKQDRREEKTWLKMKQRAILKGAWIED